MEAERLQKVIAAAGVASRRAAEELISAGRVTVDGRVARLGDRVDPETAVVEVDGRPVGAAATLVHLAVNKPAGVTSTVRDRHAAMTVLELVPTALIPDGVRLYPVGRLDQDSEGLLLLTNDGDWAERVLHPRFGVEREYSVGLREPLAEEQVTEVIRGIRLEEGLARLAQPLRRSTGAETRRLEGLLDPPAHGLTWYRAVLSEGWKRQLRRMFGAVGAPIDRLVRVRIGHLRLDDSLPTGRARRLRADEIRRLGAGRISAKVGHPAGGARHAGGKAPHPRRPPTGRPDRAADPT